MLSRNFLFLMLIPIVASTASAQQKSQTVGSSAESDLIKRMAIISKSLGLPNVGGIPVVGNEFTHLNALDLSRKQEDVILQHKATLHDRIALGYCEALTEINVPMNDWHLVNSSQSTAALAIYHNLLGEAACQPYVKKYGKSIWLGEDTNERMEKRRLFLEKHGERLKSLAIKPPFIFAAYVRVKVDTLNYDPQRKAFPIKPLADDGFSGTSKFELRVSIPMSFFTNRRGLTTKPVTYTKEVNYDFPRWWNIKPSDRKETVRLIDQASIRKNGTKNKPTKTGGYFIHALVDIEVTPDQAQSALENMPRGQNSKTFPIGANFHSAGTAVRLRYYLRPDFKVRISDYDIRQ